MIKLVLILGLVAIAYVALRGRPTAGNLAVRRLSSVGVLFVGVVAVLFPDLVTRLANLLGVGRGTDLVLYAFVVAFLFAMVSIYQRLRDIEERYATLVRRMALSAAADENHNRPDTQQLAKQQTAHE